MKENYSTLSQKIEDLESLTFDEVTTKIENEPYLGYPASLIADEMEHEGNQESNYNDKRLD